MTNRWAAPVALAFLSQAYALALAQTTAFTYQGRLNAGASPAAGLYDFRFQLAADPLGNVILATTMTDSVPVINGLFTANLDFGSAPFNGSNYWLEVDVRTNRSADYTPLHPLQPLAPTPYALFAKTAGTLTGTLPAGQLSGAVPFDNLPAGVLTNGASGLVLTGAFAGTFTGDGSGLGGVPSAYSASRDQVLVGTGLGSIVFDPSFGSSSTASGYGFPYKTIATNEMAESPFWTARTVNLLSPQLVYYNVQSNPIQCARGSGLSFSNATVTISASLQWPAGKFYQFRFNGNSQAVVTPNGRVISDPLPVTIPSNSLFLVRTFISSSAPGWAIERNLQYGGALGLIPAGTVRAGTNDTTDLTMGGTIVGNTGYVSAPLIVGRLGGQPKPFALGLIGDSLLCYGSNYTVADTGAWETVMSNSVPYLRSLCPGGVMRDVWTNDVQLDPISSFCTHVLCQYGFNDSSLGYGNLTNEAMLAWRYYADRGLKVYQALLTPQTRSTDDWTTLSNQTIIRYDSTSTNFNAWVRTLPSPLSGYVDLRSAVESSPGSGLWKVNGTPLWSTTEGTHVNATNGWILFQPVLSNFIYSVTH